MKNLITLLVFSIVACVGTTVVAGDGDTDYTFTLDGPPILNQGTPFDVEFSFTNDGSDATGVQSGICVDSTNIDALDATDVDTVNVDALDTTFTSVSVILGDGDNDFTFGILMNVVTGAVLAAGGTTHDLHVITYHVADTIVDGVIDDCELDTVNITFCEIGTPSVPPAAIVSGVANTPVAEEYTGCVDIPPPWGEYFLSDGTLIYDPVSDPVVQVGNDAVLTISVTEDILGDLDGVETSGFQCALRHDDTYVEAVGIFAIGELSDMNGGTGPGFFGVNLVPGNGPGATVGVVYNLGAGTETIVFDEKKDVIEVDYALAEGLDGTLVDLDEPYDATLTDVTWSEDLGDPVLPNNVVVSGTSVAVITDGNDGTITLSAISDTIFLRGDCNDDGIVNIGDAIWELDELNRGGPESTCQESCDVNDDGMYDNSDPIYILNYRFLDGPEPVGQFPECGESGEFPLPDCEVQESCD